MNELGGQLKYFEGRKALPVERAHEKNLSTELPTVYSLSEAYPNPFNPETHFQLALPGPSTVSLIIYDVLGRGVAHLAAGSYPAGLHSLRWNAHNQSEHPVASGHYLARIQVTDARGKSVLVKTSKCLLVR